MDFSFNESEQALVDLAEQIIGDKVDHQALRKLEASEDRFDRSTWQALADAGLFAALLPETRGGAGLGPVASTGVLEVAARHAAVLPLLPAFVVLATVSEYGSPAHDGVLHGVADGSVVPAVALGSGVVADGEGRLSGTASFVMAGLDAHVLLVEAGGVPYVVDLGDPGVTRHEQLITTGNPDATIELDHVEAEAMPVAALDFARQRFDLGICALTAGLARGALDLAAAYTRERVQFNRVIASFQAVSQRVGDSYIDVQGLELVTHQAAWRMGEGLDATREIAIARWWAAEAGDRVVHAAVHVHGGVGVDRDYPLHRHFLLARRLELTNGTSEEHLASIGRTIAGSN